MKADQRNMTVPNFVDKTIWTGDNLDILRGMNSECVDLIYPDGFSLRAARNSSIIEAWQRMRFAASRIA